MQEQFAQYTGIGSDSHLQEFKAFQITSVYRISNPNHQNIYEKKKENLQAKHQKTPEGFIHFHSSIHPDYIKSFSEILNLDESINELITFHCSSQDPQIIESVTKQGVDWRFTKKGFITIFFYTTAKQEKIQEIQKHQKI